MIHYASGHLRDPIVPGGRGSSSMNGLRSEMFFSLGLPLGPVGSSGPVLRGPTGGRSVSASIFDVQPPPLPHILKETIP